MPVSTNDERGTARVRAHGDVILSADTNVDGVGDLVFETGGVERARIKFDGTGGGFGSYDKAYSLTADQAFATTSLADVTQMVVPVVVSALYEFEASLYLSSPDTAGLEFGVNGPTSSTVWATLFGSTTTTAATGCNIQALNTKAGTPFAAINGLGLVVIRGWFATDGTHAGNFSVQADKKTSGSGSVLKGSVLRWRRAY